MICKIAPQHLGLLRFIGGLALTYGLISLYTGKSYYRKTVIKAEEPLAYWLTTSAYLILGAACLIGTFVCPVIG